MADAEEGRAGAAGIIPAMIQANPIGSPHNPNAQYASSGTTMSKTTISSVRRRNRMEILCSAIVVSFSGD